jgi:hypothetical protein
VPVYVVCSHQQRYLYSAEGIWRTTRQLWPVGEDEHLDKLMAMNRVYLDEIAVLMNEDMPDDLRDARSGLTFPEAEDSFQMDSDEDSVQMTPYPNLDANDGSTPATEESVPNKLKDIPQTARVTDNPCLNLLQVP